MINIGPYTIRSPIILAPMAGITDVPFRELCLSLGAGMATSEMLTSDTRLWNSNKSKRRLRQANTASLRSVQIAGNDPTCMAEAARYNEALGADIVDINMGCPAKKVCRRAAGSALLKDEQLVANILRAVTRAVNIPITLKIRTGWDTSSRNGVTIAKMAENYGVAALAVHGRTRACRFKGQAEYDTIAEIVQAVDIPVFANGDITSAIQAKYVLDYTGAAGVMIGRAAQGNPWIFSAIENYLTTGKTPQAPSFDEVSKVVVQHIQAMHSFYGDYLGLRIARKHIGWYLDRLGGDGAVKRAINHIEVSKQQIDALRYGLQSLKMSQAKAA